MIRTLASLDDTDLLASQLALVLEPGDIVELEGEVGAGKTTFVGALARALGSREPARSPTYTVAHAYALPDGRTLAHLDCYRAGEVSLDAAAWGDVEPYFAADTIACIEWPAPIRQWLAGRVTWRLAFTIVDLETRRVRIDVPVGRRAPDGDG